MYGCVLLCVCVSRPGQPDRTNQGPRHRRKARSSAASRRGSVAFTLHQRTSANDLTQPSLVSVRANNTPYEEEGGGEDSPQARADRSGRVGLGRDQFGSGQTIHAMPAWRVWLGYLGAAWHGTWDDRMRYRAYRARWIAY